MRKALTLVEVMIIMAIVFIIAAMVIPSILESRNTMRMRPGQEVIVSATGQRVVVVRITGSALLCRIDRGPQAVPRYEEVRFAASEVVPAMTRQGPEGRQ